MRPIGAPPNEHAFDDPADVARARTDRAIQACRQAMRTRLGRLVLVPIIAAAFVGTVAPRVIWCWIAVVIADTVRAQFSISRLLRQLHTHGAEPGWARRAAKGWVVAGSAFASVAIAARTAHSAEAVFIATMVAMGALALAVVIAQGFTELLVAFGTPVVLATLLNLFTGTTSQQLLGLVGLVYVATLAQIHREFGTAVRAWALLKARNERLSNELAEERDRLQASQADLELVNDRLTHEATHDPLTGLANRALLASRLDQALRHTRSDRIVGVLYVDLDRFKEVNDSGGHSTGDEILCQVATRMLSLVRATDTVARVGGDEFVVVLPQLTSVETAGALAERIRRELNRPYLTDEGGISIGATVGVATSDGSTTVDALLAHADATMYRGKDAGRNTVVVA